MTNPRLGQGLRLSALYGACFAGIGVYMPFFPVWMESRGLDAPAIGVILSLPILTRVLVTAPLVSLADRDIGARRLLIAGSFSLTFVYAALLFASGALSIAMLVVVMAVAQAPLIPLCDLIVTNAVRRDPRLDYGRIRLWGSIAFLTFSVAGGHVLGAMTADAVVALLAALSLATVGVAAVAVPSDQAHAPDASAQVEPRDLPPALWYILAAAACVQASHAGVYAFGSLHWREQGFSEPAIGYLWATGVVAEIVLFAGWGRIVGQQTFGLGFLMIGAAAAALRFSAMSAEPGLVVSFILQALHGLSFGATHLGAMAALSRLAPPGTRGRAQGLLSTAMALGMAATTALSGLIFRAAGAWVFAAMAPVALVGFVLTLQAARLRPPQPQREDEGG